MFSEIAEIALVAARLGQCLQFLKTRVILILNFTRPHAITHTNTFYLLQDPVPQKPISANRGLNLTNRRLKFIPWLDSVPESPISAGQGINEGLNLIHLARSINSLIGEKSRAKQAKWRA